MTLGKRHRIADGRTLKNEGTVTSRDGCQKLRDGFVVADFGHLDSAPYGVSRPHGSAEVPVNMQEYRTGTRQVFGNNCVQNRAGDSSLDHDSAEACRLCRLLIIV